jgi:peptidoglycan/xylan/chitin deacetylase (PgdA/CDA1 family)
MGGTNCRRELKLTTMKRLLLLYLLLQCLCQYVFSQKHITDTAQLLINADTFFTVAKYKNNKLCAISYTFDDGLKEHYTLVAPKLNELGLKGTFWINGSKINADENAIKDTTRMTWANLKEMFGDAHEISNHGWAHKNFGKFSLEEIKEDINKNDSAIFSNLGIMPKTFCYPNNTKTKEGVILASKNRVGTRTEQRSVGGKATDSNLEQWVNDLIKNEDWGVTMTHGITYGYDYFKSPLVLWNHLEKVKKLEDKIWVATFSDVVSYVKERNDLSFKIKKTKKGFVVSPKLLLDKALFQMQLTGVINQKNVRSIKIVQNKRKLNTTILADKVIFDFDPFGGEIVITLF